MKIKVGRNYNRKVQDKSLGSKGKRYESSDFGCWVEIEKEVKKKDVDKSISALSRVLDKVAKQEVKISIEKRKNELKEGEPFEDTNKNISEEYEQKGSLLSPKENK